MNRAGNNSAELRYGSALILFLIVFLGGFLRLYNLGTPYFSEDEGFHAVVAVRWAETGSPLPPSGIAYVRSVPLMALETLALRYLPFGLESSVRLPAALMGTLNIWLFFLLGRRYGGVAIGIIAATVFAVSPWAIGLGTMARMYEFLMTSTLLCLLSYERLVESPGVRNALLLAAALCLSVTAHELSILLILLPLAGILVHIRQPRLGVLLGMAIVAQLGFRIGYAAVIDLSIPSRVAAKVGPRQWFIAPLFGFQQVEGQIVLLAWLAGLVFLLAGAIFTLRHRNPKEVAYLLPGLTLILGFGAAGSLIAAGLAFAVFFVLADQWQGPETARVHRRYLGAFYMATILFWVLLAVVIALAQEPFNISNALQALKSTIRYPAILSKAIVPLLNDPRTIALFYVGMAGLALAVVRTLRKGSLLPAHASLNARLLFLLGSLCAVGMGYWPYTSNRYVYFLLPVALLSFLEIMKAYWQVSEWRTRAGFVLVGFLVFGFSELPHAVGQVPDRDGHRKIPHRVRWLPDYFGSEDQLKKRREWKQLDYRAAAGVISTRFQEGDILLVDAPHQLQAYLPETTIQAHLIKRQADVQFGDTHYFTGSVELRTPEHMIRFLEPYGIGNSTRLWLVLSGTDTTFLDILPARLADSEVWRDGEIVIYSLPADELLAILHAAEGVIADTSQPGEEHNAAVSLHGSPATDVAGHAAESDGTTGESVQQ